MLCQQGDVIVQPVGIRAFERLRTSPMQLLAVVLEQRGVRGLLDEIVFEHIGALELARDANQIGAFELRERRFDVEDKKVQKSAYPDPAGFKARTAGSCSMDARTSAGECAAI